MALEPDQIYSLTTLTSGVKGFYETPPSSKPFPRPYFDDYEGQIVIKLIYMHYRYALHVIGSINIVIMLLDYEKNGEPHYFVPQTGVWEIRKETEVSHNKVSRQVVLRKPIDWCYTGDYTVSVGGDYIWLVT